MAFFQENSSCDEKKLLHIMSNIISNIILFKFYSSIEVKSAAYYQQLQLQQQQQAQAFNQRNPGGLNYANQNNENIYMPRVLKNYDEHESSPRMYPPHAQFEQQNSNYEPQLSPSR